MKDEEREDCEIGAWVVIIAIIIAIVVSFALGYTFYASPGFKKSPFSDVLMMSIVPPLSGVVAAMIWILLCGEFSNGKTKKRINKNVYKFYVMETNNLMIFPDLNQEEFDFNSLVGNKQYGIMAGIPVKIDRIIRDVTQTTVIAVSGTMVLKGVKMRGVWDMYGNIVEFKKTFSLLTPKGFSMDALFSSATDRMFQLVHIQQLDKAE